VRWHGGDVLAIEDNAPSRDRLKTDHTLEQGTFTGTVGANDRHDLALRDFD
jgi:hypothetical protein